MYKPVHSYFKSADSMSNTADPMYKPAISYCNSDL
jgi:hypothetical protein